MVFQFTRQIIIDRKQGRSEYLTPLTVAFLKPPLVFPDFRVNISLN